ncbi:MAG: RagB/SusD family nutrient uptake outer membrane protein [Niabella sp.]|nr:RagB/SusD family nutrient uptake outer membrane protein [Niabella sp.]
MKRKNTYISILLTSLGLMTLLASCEKSLDEVSYDKFSGSSFYKTEEDAKLAVTAVYSSMNSGGYSIWGVGYPGIVAQSSASTDEMVVSWGWPGWPLFNQLNLSETFPGDALFQFYNILMPTITNATINIGKIEAMNIADGNLKKRYIGELKALRAHYSQILYNYYGPVPVRLDPVEAANPDAKPIPRPSQQDMVAQIEKDYKEAADALPAASEQGSADYGRFTKDACLMGLVKLYMHEKKWPEVITTCRSIQGMGHSLQGNYADIFSYANNGSKQEILLAVSCRPDANSTNIWLAHALPGNYADPSGKEVTQWGGYKMPWATYDKFNPNDKRLARLLAKWPTTGGATFDARANGYIGAIPMKYGIDPNATGEGHGTNIVVWRYADVLLSLAEAINETSGPTAEAYNLVKEVRNRAGLGGLPDGLGKDQFRDKLKDERLFEFWCEGGIRREDLIRWGTYIKRATDAGSTFAKPEFVLWPIPRKAIDESKGVIKQNPGYN